ncbi:hypothetical protein L9F63_010540, partial [Diploptera punctata]
STDNIKIIRIPNINFYNRKISSLKLSQKMGHNISEGQKVSQSRDSSGKNNDFIRKYHLYVFVSFNNYRTHLRFCEIKRIHTTKSLNKKLKVETRPERVRAQPHFLPVSPVTELNFNPRDKHLFLYLRAPD